MGIACEACRQIKSDRMTEITAEQAEIEPYSAKKKIEDVNKNQEGLRIDESKEKQRKQKKRGKVALFIGELNQHNDNIEIQEGNISADDIEQIKKSLRKHFIFSQLPESELDVVVSKLKPCTAKQGSYIFKQNDKSDAYYIILQGECSILINDEQKRVLKFGDSFGDLGIVYHAPRSASVLAITDMIMVMMGKKQFNLIIQEINRLNEEENKKLLEVASFFSELTEEQKNVLASHCNSQIYEAGQTIFRSGDAANSFYVIKSGIVFIKEKDLDLTAPQCFGENALLSETSIRSHTLVAKTKAQMLSISRESLQRVLGGTLNVIIKKNISWSLVKEKIPFQEGEENKWRSNLEKSVIQPYKAKQIVIKKGTRAKKILFITIMSALEGETKKYEANSILELEIYLNGDDALFTEDLIAIQDGFLCKLPAENRRKADVSSIHSSVAKSELFDKKLIIGNFLVVKRLRSGNFGQVYACYNISTKKIYAIKVLDHKSVTQSHLVEYVINEEEILRTLPKHPFIMGFHKLLKDQLFIYFVLEYIPGEDLFDTITREGFFDDEKVRFLLGQILLAIQHLHNHWVIYRDLKPENIMMGLDGYLTLIDMGTAKRLKIEKRFRTKTIIGTPHYMAPEIIIGKGYSFSVDLWSLGILGYELAIGKLPFAENLEDPFSIYEQVVNSTPKFPRKCKKEIKNFLERLLVKDPKSRLNDFNEIKKEDLFYGLDWEMLLAKRVPSFYSLPASSGITSGDIELALIDPAAKCPLRFASDLLEKPHP